MDYIQTMYLKHAAFAPRFTLLPAFVAAAFLMFVTAVAAASGDRVQDWVPVELEMPADIEVLTDREIGSSLRMFSFSTQSDVDALLADWEQALALAGYAIIQGEGDLLERVIEFSGQGISNAKIAVVPAASEDTTIIEFDATLQ